MKWVPGWSLCSTELEPESGASAATDDENELDLSPRKLPSILVDGDTSLLNSRSAGKAFD